MHGNGKEKELFETFHQFHKLNFASVLPDISQNELCTLAAISHCPKEMDEEGIKVSLLAKKTKVATSAMSRTLKVLEEREFIERSIDKKDRRNTYVKLTKKGQDKVDECETILSEITQNVFAKLGEEDFERLIKYLKQMYELAKVEIELRKNKTDREDEK